MNDIQEIFGEYARMRNNGLDTRTTLQAMRGAIERLNKAQREELASLLRDWEENDYLASEIEHEEAPPPPSIKKISRIKPINEAEAPSDPADTTQPERGETMSWVSCPNCGKTNQRHEVFCYACGQLLEPLQGAHTTQHFSEADSNSLGRQFFGPDSVLAIRVRGTAESTELRPQYVNHEIIIGRSIPGSPIVPDVDLSDKHAADQGVSRMHANLTYDPEQNVILVSDLGSANGSYLNGERLVAKEVRVLRHGDELRLGRLVVLVSFRHPAIP
ncbi:MAG: FHA domain-containing protein [Anaerolineaceae bacterium]|nr:FHA domain-containing protein [Anaerolineaceae bacterium]